MRENVLLPECAHDSGRKRSKDVHPSHPLPTMAPSVRSEVTNEEPVLVANAPSAAADALPHEAPIQHPSDVGAVWDRLLSTGESPIPHNARLAPPRHSEAAAARMAETMRQSTAALKTAMKTANLLELAEAIRTHHYGAPRPVLDKAIKKRESIRNLKRVLQTLADERSGGEYTRITAPTRQSSGDLFDAIAPVDEAREWKSRTAEIVRGDTAAAPTGTLKMQILATGMKPSTYAAHIKESPKWGGPIEMAILAKEYNLRVHVYEKINLSRAFRKIAIISTPTTDGSTQDVHILYSGNDYYYIEYVIPDS